MSVSQLIKPYLCFNPEDEKASRFAQKLKHIFANTTYQDCNVILGIGGDGTNNYAFDNLPNKPVFTVKPYDSRSNLYYGHIFEESVVNNPEMLGIVTRTAIENATLHTYHPLKGKINLSNGETFDIKANSDIIIRSDTAQASFINLSSNFSDTIQRFNGDGLIFASGIGSTGATSSHYGRYLSLGQNGIVITGMGVYHTELEAGYEPYLTQENRSYSSAFNDLSFQFIAEIVSAGHKRPPKILYDGATINPDGSLYKIPNTVSDDKVITHVEVGLDLDRPNLLLINNAFRTDKHLDHIPVELRAGMANHYQALRATQLQL